MSISIKGLSKAAVLAALYNASQQQGMGFLHQRGATGMTVEEARKEIEASPDMYFDYLHGRVMKVGLKGDELEERLYDRDNGSGAAYQALSSLLASSAAPSAGREE